MLHAFQVFKVDISPLLRASFVQFVFLWCRVLGEFNQDCLLTAISHVLDVAQYRHVGPRGTVSAAINQFDAKVQYSKHLVRMWFSCIKSLQVASSGQCRGQDFLAGWSCARHESICDRQVRSQKRTRAQQLMVTRSTTFHASGLNVAVLFDRISTFRVRNSHCNAQASNNGSGSGKSPRRRPGTGGGASFRSRGQSPPLLHYDCVCSWFRCQPGKPAARQLPVWHPPHISVIPALRRDTGRMWYASERAG